jgi:hypothetical protein
VCETKIRGVVERSCVSNIRRQTPETPEAVSLHGKPLTFRLPKTGVADPFFGLSRAFYYAGEQRGYWQLIRLCDEGKVRGITLIPYAQVERYVRSKIEGQK